MLAQTRVSQSDLEAELDQTLAALQEIDRWYDWESGLLQLHPNPIKQGLIKGLEERHRRNREPYVQHLAQIYHALNSNRLFENSRLLSMKAPTGLRPLSL